MAIETDWLQSLLGQRLYVDGVEVLPTVKRWNLVGFAAAYDAITGIVTITSTTSGATQVDWKESCRLVSAANRALNGLGSVDGVALAADQRVLLAGQTTASENGIWISAAGAWSRAPDANVDAEVTAGATVRITEGATYAGSQWSLQGPDPFVLGVTAQTWVQTEGSALGAVYSCPGGAAVRDVVYLAGADAVDLADNDDPAKQPAIGMIVGKPTATTAIVRSSGDVVGFAGLTVGATYYLSSTAGQLTPTAPQQGVDPPGTIVQAVGYARSGTVLVLMVDRNFVTLS